MVLTLDDNQTAVLGEILASALKLLRLERARAESHDFREALHARERVIEHMLYLLTHEPRYDSPPSVL